MIITQTYLLIIFLNHKINLHSVFPSESPIRNHFAISLETFQKQSSVVAVCSRASRETSDVGSNVTAMLLIPQLKVKLQCLCKGGAGSECSVSVSSSASGRCNLKTISGLPGIVFNLGLFGVLKYGGSNQFKSKC